MFRGFNNLALDAKGRVSIPARYREQLIDSCDNKLVLTVHPWDPALLLYPAPRWEVVEQALSELPDADVTSRRTKQRMQGYANDCGLDGHGRLLLPPEHRARVGLDRDVIVLGQKDHCAIWSKAEWDRVCQEHVQPGVELPQKLRDLSL